METLVFNRVDNTYSGKYSTIGMGLLEGFLLYDVGNKNIFTWVEFLTDSKQTFEIGNYCYIEKIDSEIIMGFEDRALDSETDAEVFETTINELNYILDRWQEACEKKPNKIIITHDNGKVTVEFED